MQGIQFVARIRRRSPIGLLVVAASVLVAIIALAVVRFGSGQVHAAATVPAFNCSSTLYLVADKQFYSLNLVNGTRTAIGAAYANDYNAMGYDVADNFIYAIDRTTHHLVRVGSDGSVEDLGLPTGLPAADYYIGDMDGTSLDVINGASPGAVYSIDVSTGVATAHALSGVAIGNIADITNIGGTLYGAAGNTLYAINLSSYTVSKTSVAGLSASSYDGSSWTDSSGDLLLFDNPTGGVYLVTDPTTATPSAHVVATLPASNDDDGASCPAASSPPLPTPTATNTSVPPTATETFTPTVTPTVTATSTATAPPSTGAFVIGDVSAGMPTIGQSVNFWGPQWAKKNALSGGHAPSSMKGFADDPASLTCGSTWTTRPGHSSAPPATLPGTIEVIVSSNVTQSGSTIGGDIQHIVVVRVSPGYGPAPGLSGYGTIVSTIC